MSAEPLRCIVCSGPSTRVFGVDGYWIRACSACGHHFAELQADRESHVRQTYGDDYFFGGGAGYADYLSEAAIVRAHGRRYAEMLRGWMAAPGAVLDVGAAGGFFLQGLVDAGWSGVGVEPNRTLAEYGRSVLSLVIENTALEDFASTRRFDLVTMVQVLPHFIDPRAALIAAAGLTRPDGLLLIESWDRASLTARLFGRRWHEYSPPSVLHWFSRDGLTRLAHATGFAPVAQGRPRKRLNAAHALSLLRHKMGGRGPGTMLVRMLDRIPPDLVIPYPAEDLFWMLFRRTGQHEPGSAT